MRTDETIGASQPPRIAARHPLVLTITVIALLLGGLWAGGLWIVLTDDVPADIAHFRRIITLILGAVTMIGVVLLVQTLGLIRRLHGAEAALAQRDQRLRAATAAAEAASRAKAEFLGMMSHEIRTPLNGILGMAQVLRNRDLDSGIKDCADTILRSGRTLLGLLNNVLDLTRIESGRMPLVVEPLDLRDVIETALDPFGFAARRKGIALGLRFVPAAPPPLLGDAGRIGQVIINLIGNAVKFTASGRVFVEVKDEGLRNGKRALCIEVQDTGVGIPLHLRPQLFQPFVQADSSDSRPFGGTGLGLALASRLAAMMGGSLRYRPNDGRGSVFCLRFELPQAEIPAEPNPPLLAGKTVVVADRDPDLAADVLASVKDWGGEAVFAETLAEIVPHRERADVMIVDGGMVDGAWAKPFRGESNTPPLIFLTPHEADLTLSDPGKGMVILARPARRDRLEAAIRDVLSGAQKTMPTAAPTPSSGSEVRPVRVLVAEDNETNQLVMRSFLKRLNFPAEFVNDGREAFVAVQSGRFDLVFMDCQMPVMDGYGATAAIRAFEKERGKKRIPIVAITANAMDGDKARCLNAGMDAYIAKPCYLEDIEAALILWLQPGRGLEPSADLPLAEAVAVDTALADTSPASGDGDPDLDRETLERLRADLGELAPVSDRFDALLDGQVKAILEAGFNGDSERMRKAAHSLKGGSRSLGLKRLSALCDGIEHNAKNGDIEAARGLATDLADLAHKARLALRAAV